MTEPTKAQLEWIAIGASMRTGLQKKLNAFAKNPDSFEVDNVRSMIVSICEALEFDILANAFDRAVEARIDDDSPNDGEPWRESLGED